VARTAWIIWVTSCCYGDEQRKVVIGLSQQGLEVPERSIRKNFRAVRERRVVAGHSSRADS